MNEHAIVRARTTPATAPAQPASVVPQDEWASRLQFANALSKAGGMFPETYHNNPGALLALMSWAEKHGKDIVSAGQGVYPSKDGGLIVSADMRTELANDRGFDIIDVTDDDKRQTECTVEVRTPTGERHCLTVRLADVHDSVKGPTTKGKPSAWMVNPADMLLRMAQRQADKRFCRSAAVLIDRIDDDLAVDDDPVETIHNSAGVEPEPAGSDTEATPSPDVEQSEQPSVDDLGAPPITEQDLRAVGKVPDLIKAAKKLSGRDVPLVGDIAKDQALAAQVLAEVTQQ